MEFFVSFFLLPVAGSEMTKHIPRRITEPPPLWKWQGMKRRGRKILEICQDVVWSTRDFRTHGYCVSRGLYSIALKRETKKA